MAGVRPEHLYPAEGSERVDLKTQRSVLAAAEPMDRAPLEAAA